nr:hypothetical transcript [Hymenolepis microstoma]
MESNLMSKMVLNSIEYAFQLIASDDIDSFSSHKHGAQNSQRLLICPPPQPLLLPLTEEPRHKMKVDAFGSLLPIDRIADLSRQHKWPKAILMASISSSNADLFCLAATKK